MVNCFQHFLMKSIFQTGISQQQSIQITYHFVYTYIIYIVFLLWKIIAVTLTTKKLCWSENVTFRLKCLARAGPISVLWACIYAECCVSAKFVTLPISWIAICSIVVLIMLWCDAMYALISMIIIATCSGCSVYSVMLLLVLWIKSWWKAKLSDIFWLRIWLIAGELQ